MTFSHDLQRFVNPNANTNTYDLQHIANQTIRAPPPLRNVFVSPKMF